MPIFIIFKSNAQRISKDNRCNSKASFKQKVADEERNRHRKDRK